MKCDTCKYQGKCRYAPLILLGLGVKSCSKYKKREGVKKNEI